MRACQHFLFVCVCVSMVVADGIEQFLTRSNLLLKHSLAKRVHHTRTLTFSSETIHLAMLSCFQSLKPYIYPGFQSLKPYTHLDFHWVTENHCTATLSQGTWFPRRQSFAPNQTVELTGCPSRMRCRWQLLIVLLTLASRLAKHGTVISAWLLIIWI